LSWWLLLYSLFIPGYAPFARKIIRLLPNPGLIFYIGSILVVGIYFIYFARLKILPTLLSLPIFLLAGYFMLSLKLVEERVHILEFMALGFLGGADRKLKIHPLLLVFFVSFIDEGFQYILPGRVFDLRDILHDLLGGLLGLGLAVIWKRFQKQV